MTRFRFLTALAVVALLAPVLTGSAAAQGERTFRVTIENLMPATGMGASQVLSPALVVVHTNKVDLFEVGEPASPSVADVAEDAITATGIAALSGAPGVASVTQEGGLIGPGMSGSFEVTAKGPAHLLSLVTMLVNTNDGFTGLDGVKLTKPYQEFMVYAYDAGSEVNDQLQASIPGPCCGDTDRNGTDEFGVIEMHQGLVMGVGDIDVATYGWPAMQPAARITVERVR